MIKKYYKNQVLIIVIIVLGLLFTIKQFIEYNDTINTDNIFITKIIKQNCHAAPRMKSTVWINFNEKIYSIGIPYNECVNYPIGNNIKVLYNKNNDEFIYKVENPKYLKNIILLGIFLIISFLPWQYINEKLFKKVAKY
ncbi:hypothetical protein [Chryseobacterium indologenes]|uniref:DUF3592 domain-containing protein n=1 Tax=Chryseobacterium indologenes TaxID=253 RepID=A0A0N0ZWG9_CHRID|nr:hypothetical protein [Chryseobacterium indologenes]KPE49787.1 hypothetical protein AOB46_17600 [Chryseobacterium indologenes]